MKKRYLLFILLPLLAYSCLSDKESDNQEKKNNEIENIIEEMPTIEGLEISDIYLPNGETVKDYLKEVGMTERKEIDDPYKDLGPQDSRNLLIARTINQIINKILPKKMEHDNGEKIDPIDEIKNNDDAYSLYYYIFYDDKKNKNDAIKNAEKNIKTKSPRLQKILIENLGAIPMKNFETGDVIIWEDVDLKGLILKNKENELLVMFVYNKPDNTKKEKIVELKKAEIFGDNKPYEIIRINSEISGKWKVYFRCVSQIRDVFSFNLNFNKKEKAEFKVKGEGIDYDGNELTCDGKIKYSSVTNELSGSFFIKNKYSPIYFYRNDSFIVKLDRDETKYFKMRIGDYWNAGCYSEGRLVNME